MAYLKTNVKDLKDEMTKYISSYVTSRSHSLHALWFTTLYNANVLIDLYFKIKYQLWSGYILVLWYHVMCHFKIDQVISILLVTTGKSCKITLRNVKNYVDVKDPTVIVMLWLCDSMSH